MCPKAKPQQVIVHRIELQEKEREALDMMAASYAANNASKAINNIISPFTMITTSGLALGGLIWASLMHYKANSIERALARGEDVSTEDFLFTWFENAWGPGIVFDALTDDPKQFAGERVNLLRNGANRAYAWWDKVWTDFGNI